RTVASCTCDMRCASPFWITSGLVVEQAAKAATASAASRFFMDWDSSGERFFSERVGASPVDGAHNHMLNRWWAIEFRAACKDEKNSGVETTVPRHARQQELHLVDQDAAAAQDHVLVQVGHVGQEHERHVRFLGQAVALAPVAGPARGDAVHPRVAAAARG